MTTPKVKCDECGYEGDAGVEVLCDSGRWICAECGKIDEQKCKKAVILIENALFELNEKEREYVINKLF